MGIIILVFAALGIFGALRGVYRYGKACIKPLVRSTTAGIHATPATTQSAVLNEPDWLAYATPAFIRRGISRPVLTEKQSGISRPVLTEKQKKRVRKTKSANTSLADQLAFLTQAGELFPA